MKRLWDLLVLVLALNFLALAGGVGWLYQSGHLNRERVAKVREAIFPPPEPPATQPAPIDPTTQPTLRIDELLARRANLTAGQQVDFIRETFDSQTAQLDRRTRELSDFKAQVDLANAKLSEDRAALEADRKALTAQREQAGKLATDKGFQDTLNLYNSMPARQVKTIFLTLNDDAMVQYLQAMEPRTAGKVIKEFKAPEELERIQRVMETMRKGPAATQPTKE